MEYRRSLCILILTLTVLRPSYPSLFSVAFASLTISATSSRLFISAAPRHSAHAQDWGQPQLRSTPDTKGAMVLVARANSRGELAPNWRIVGTDVGEGGSVKSWKGLEPGKGKGGQEGMHTTVSGVDASVEFFCQNLWKECKLRLLVIIQDRTEHTIGVQQRSTPYLCTVWRKASSPDVSHNLVTCRLLSRTLLYLTIGAEVYSGLPCSLAISNSFKGLGKY